MLAKSVRKMNIKMVAYSLIISYDSTQLTGHSFADWFGSNLCCCWGGTRVKKFLFDAFETVVAELFVFVLASVAMLGRKIGALLGCCGHLGHLTFDVIGAVHYFNINFI